MEPALQQYTEVPMALQRPHVAMGGSAFVYGTLMAPEVVQTLIRRVPPMRSATLHGYTRYRVKGEVFPAIVPDPVPEAVVRGKLLSELSEAELAILDAYESVEYYRQTVEPVLEDGTKCTADVYVWKDDYRDTLELLPWDYEDFRMHHLQSYVASTAEFMNELAAGEARS